MAPRVDQSVALEDVTPEWVESESVKMYGTVHCLLYCVYSRSWFRANEAFSAEQVKQPYHQRYCTAYSSRLKRANAHPSIEPTEAAKLLAISFLKRELRETTHGDQRVQPGPRTLRSSSGGTSRLAVPAAAPAAALAPAEAPAAAAASLADDDDVEDEDAALVQTLSTQLDREVTLLGFLNANETAAVRGDLHSGEQRTLYGEPATYRDFTRRHGSRADVSSHTFPSFSPLFVIHCCMFRRNSGSPRYHGRHR